MNGCVLLSKFTVTSRYMSALPAGGPVFEVQSPGVSRILISVTSRVWKVHMPDGFDAGAWYQRQISESAVQCTPRFES